MPSVSTTLYFHQGSTITSYPNPIVIGLRNTYKGNIEEVGAYISIGRTQSWHQMYLLREFWPKNDDDPKFRHIQKATKSFAYDEDTKACKNIINRLAISSTSFFGENHLYYFTQANSNNCAICGAVEGIMKKQLLKQAFMIVIIFEKKTF
jgi:hypothetical protein